MNHLRVVRDADRVTGSPSRATMDPDGTVRVGARQIGIITDPEVRDEITRRQQMDSTAPGGRSRPTVPATPTPPASTGGTLNPSAVVKAITAAANQANRALVIASIALVVAVLALVK